MATTTTMSLALSWFLLTAPSGESFIFSRLSLKLDDIFTPKWST